MLEFLKFGRKNKIDAERSSRSFIRGTADGSVTVVNLERTGWALDPDGSGRAILDLRPASVSEVFDEKDHEDGLRGGFLRLGRESTECRLLRSAIDRRTPVIMIYPGIARMRGVASELFEEFLKRRFKVESRDLDAIKIYAAPVRPDAHRFVRKFRGLGADQVVCNLTGEAFKYLHLYKDDRDVTIDAVDSEWPIGSDADDDAFIDLIEKAIRGMDTEYFDRLRQAIAARTLLLLLPEERRQRMAVLGTAGRLLLQAPGGEIDLGCGNAMHLFRSRA
ncbi:MAG: hypothetical protein O3A19_02680 [Planctomycetota bacterium]|jgi:hypothetical protein|nr:hypothetical protein [Planctomycetota bacterium]MDA1025313.1 hypothetical protein [Planctomycetota bacterium]